MNAEDIRSTISTIRIDFFLVLLGRNMYSKEQFPSNSVKEMVFCILSDSSLPCVTWDRRIPTVCCKFYNIIKLQFWDIACTVGYARCSWCIDSRTVRPDRSISICRTCLVACGLFKTKGINCIATFANPWHNKKFFCPNFYFRYMRGHTNTFSLQIIFFF